MVRLVDGTEVYVAPKLRNRSTTPSNTIQNSFNIDKNQHLSASKPTEGRAADRAIVRIAALRSTLSADTRDNAQNVLSISENDLKRLRWNEVEFQDI